MELLANGRECDVFAVSEGRVLRRTRTGRSQEAEAEVMRWLRGQGYPVPEVFDASGADMVMERVEGQTMLEAIPRRPWQLRSAAVLLASLQHRLHALVAPEWLPPAAGAPGTSVLHRDFHPANVILSADGPIVIDWPNACRGAAADDVAQTWLIMATSEVPGAVWERVAANVFRKLFVRTYLARFDRAEVTAALPGAAAYRLADRNLRAGERARIESLVARSA